jgi:hypothetical protein
LNQPPHHTSPARWRCDPVRNAKTHMIGAIQNAADISAGAAAQTMAQLSDKE